MKIYANSNRAVLPVILIFFCMGNASLAAPPVKIEVTDADPNNALQGADPLDVTVTGQGFTSTSSVRFLVTGTDDDQWITAGDPFDVTGDGTEMTVTIVIDAEALPVDYDIEVRSGKRRGKGTTLFRVNNKDPNNETGTTACSDGIDNDGDGKIDGEDEDCSGAAKPERDKNRRGTSIPLVVTLDDHPGDSLKSDGDGPYIDGERKVVARAGESLPSRLYVHPQNTGNNYRVTTVRVQCESIPDTGAGDAIDNCGLLAGKFGDPFTFTGGYIFQVVPYSINCPEAPNPCDDVFSMGASTRLFSFNLLSGVAPIIESASDIGGSTAVEAGRCLSLLPTSQREHFVNNVCADPADCNVSVTGSDLDTDGDSDDWMVDGIGITALICDENTVFGQTTLNIGYHARLK